LSDGTQSVAELLLADRVWTFRCLTCGAELPGRGHLDWCADRVWHRDAPRRPRTHADLADLLSRLANQPTIGAIRRQKEAA
jgi:hypothetical protein